MLNWRSRRGISKNDQEIQSKLIKLALWQTMRSLYGITGSAKYEFSMIHVNNKKKTQNIKSPSYYAQFSLAHFHAIFFATQLFRRPRSNLVLTVFYFRFSSFLSEAIRREIVSSRVSFFSSSFERRTPIEPDCCYFCDFFG